MKVTTSNLIRFSGLALVPAGIVFAGIQPIHPPDVLFAKITDEMLNLWATIVRAVVAMASGGSAGVEQPASDPSVTANRRVRKDLEIL